MRLIRVDNRAMFFFVGLMIWAISGLGGAGGARAEITCNHVAAPTGVDGSAGSLTAPWATVNYMVDHLNSGETGCFKGGTYSFSEAGFRRSGVTVSSYPGETATLRGTLKVQPGAEGVTVTNLDLDGRGASNIGPFVFGNGARFINDDVTNEHSEICFVVGSSNSADPPTAGVILEHNRIHGCGSNPSTNQDHGIYVANSVGLIIRENWIYENTDRGIQLYPDAVGTQVYGNVIDGNGEGVIISNGSTGNVIRNNVITNSRIRWNIEASNLYGTGNVVTDNCLWSSQKGYYGSEGGVMSASERGPGLSVTSNTVVDPQYANSGAADFATSSPCLPSGTQVPAASTPTPVSAPAPAPAPPAEVSVTLHPAASQVPQNVPVTLEGTVSGPEQAGSSSSVTIQILKNDHWRKLTKVHVKKGGRYKVRRKIGRRLAAEKAHLRAKVASFGSSRSVTVRFRS